MTALFMDGFDHYGSTEDIAQSNMMNGSWLQVNGTTGGTNFDTAITVPSWGSARTGPFCLRSGVRATQWARRALPATTTRIFVSFGFAVDSFDTNASNTQGIIAIMDGSANSLGYLKTTTTGGIQLMSAAGAVIASTAGPVLSTHTWHFLEMDINTAGNWTLRVDDALASEAPVLTGALTGGTIAQIGVLQTRTASTPPDAPFYYMDDLFVRNAAGSVNNDWLGDRRVATMFPNADTDHDGWDPHFFKQISVGHARLANVLTGTSTLQSSTAVIKTAQASALNIGNQDFTLESRVRFDRLPLTTEYYTIFNKWNESDTNGRSYQFRYTGPTDGNVLEFRTSTDGTSGTVVSKIRYPWQPDYGTWYDIALCRVAGELILLVDGVQLGLPIADSDTYFASTTSAISIGAQLNSSTTTGAGVAGSVLIGRLDETRFTNGVGRYSGSYTPNNDTLPRGAVDDPDWSNVVLLMGYDQTVSDESSFARTMVASNGATNILAIDGNPPGVYTTVDKAAPDDNTFIRASLTSATNIFTMTTNAADNDTVTVGTKTGPAAAVYRFKTVLAAAFDVLIGATFTDSLNNLLAAINLGAGSGTLYHAGTTANLDVLASNLPAGQIKVTALIAGTVGNSIAVAESSPGVWDDPATLTGGLDIPARSSFKLQRPPTNTTIISAVQLTNRAAKTDSGVGSFKAGLIGPLGGIDESSAHALTVGGSTYNDIFETDPDTSGPISPTTLINGRVSVDRTL